MRTYIRVCIGMCYVLFTGYHLHLFHLLLLLFWQGEGGVIRVVVVQPICSNTLASKDFVLRMTQCLLSIVCSVLVGEGAREWAKQQGFPCDDHRKLITGSHLLMDILILAYIHI